VDTLLGLIGIVVWILCVIALAAGVTWVIVKLFPTGKPSRPAESGPES
jgi:hypothetical protein